MIAAPRISDEVDAPVESTKAADACFAIVAPIIDRFNHGPIEYGRDTEEIHSVLCEIALVLFVVPLESSGHLCRR